MSQLLSHFQFHLNHFIHLSTCLAQSSWIAMKNYTSLFYLNCLTYCMGDLIFMYRSVPLCTVPYSLLLISNKFWDWSLLHCVQSYPTVYNLTALGPWRVEGEWALKPLMYIKLPVDLWLIRPCMYVMCLIGANLLLGQLEGLGHESLDFFGPTLPMALVMDLPPSITLHRAVPINHRFINSYN